ncbi:unnamed protein product [Prunus armeniaca]
MLKKKLGAVKGELPEALWAINTSYRRSTYETPFSLAFGTEVVVPVEINAPTCRTTSYDPKQNEAQLALNLDLSTNADHSHSFGMLLPNSELPDTTMSA